MADFLKFAKDGDVTFLDTQYAEFPHHWEVSGTANIASTVIMDPAQPLLNTVNLYATINFESSISTAIFDIWEIELTAQIYAQTVTGEVEYLIDSFGEIVTLDNGKPIIENDLGVELTLGDSDALFATITPTSIIWDAELTLGAPFGAESLSGLVAINTVTGDVGFLVDSADRYVINDAGQYILAYDNGTPLTLGVVEGLIGSVVIQSVITGLPFVEGTGEELVGTVFVNSVISNSENFNIEIQLTGTVFGNIEISDSNIQVGTAEPLTAHIAILLQIGDPLAITPYTTEITIGALPGIPNANLRYRY